MYLKDIAFGPFRKRYWLFEFWATISKMSTLKIDDLGIFLLTRQFILILIQSISHRRGQLQKTPNFLEELNSTFQGYLNILPKLWLTFCRKYKKRAISIVVMTITPLRLLFELYPLVYFISALQDLQKKVHGVPPLHFVLVCKTHTYVPKMTLSNLLTYIVELQYEKK